MATPVICPECDDPIVAEDVNVQEGVAFCRQCELLHRLTDILTAREIDEDDFDSSSTAPPGCELQHVGLWTSVRCTCRNMGLAGFMLMFTTFWNGIVSVFVCLAIAETLRYATGSVPAWFPAPSSNSGSMFGNSLGGLLFFWLFLTPFILVGITTACLALLSIFGVSEVRIRGNDGLARTGIGPFRWTKRFRTPDVTAVRIKLSDNASDSGSRTRSIEIECRRGKSVRVGSMLTKERRSWMAKQLRDLLLSDRD